MKPVHTNLFKHAPFSQAGLISSLVVFIHRSISGYYRYRDNPTPQVALFEGERVLITTGASLVGNVVDKALVTPVLKRAKLNTGLLPTLAFGLVTTLFVIAGESLSRKLVNPATFSPQAKLTKPSPAKQAPAPTIDLGENLNRHQNPYPSLMNKERPLPAPLYYQPTFNGTPNIPYSLPRVFSDIPRL